MNSYDNITTEIIDRISALVDKHDCSAYICTDLSDFNDYLQLLLNHGHRRIAIIDNPVHELKVVRIHKVIFCVS